MVNVNINGRAYEFPEGISILKALCQIGIEVPTLCYDERVEAYGGCRLCIVKVAGWPRLAASCTTPLSDGMVIETHTREIEDERRTLLRLIAQRYPAGPVQQFPDKEFHRWVRSYGLESELHGRFDPDLRDDAHPYIHVDMSQCIYCYRCVRICEDMQGQFVWQVWHRGDRTRIRPDSETTLLDSSCVSCGACVDTCPSGALEDKTVMTSGSPMKWVKTTCPYCGTGCEMDAGTRDGRIVAIKPVNDGPTARGHLCIKGRYAFDYVYAHDRVLEPMIRRDGRWREVTWDEAIDFTVSGLRRVIEQYGVHSLGVLGSSRATNEENYLAQKFARVALGTNNVDCCARVCHAPTATAMKLMLGTGAATNSFNDIERAETILVCGANPTENHPIVGARIKQRALRGANLIVIDPREIELARYATLHLHLRPGTNIPLLNAMAHTLVEENLYDAKFIEERVSEWGEFRDFIRGWTPERAAGICGVEADLIRRAARLYAIKRPSMSIHGLGMTEHTQGTEGVMCLVNLSLLTGNIGKSGTGVNPLRGQNNVQGAAHMGCEPGSLTGAVSIQDGKESFEQEWRAPIPTRRGLNLMEMMDAAANGRFKGLWAIGYDLFLTNPDAHVTGRALKSLEFVIVQDMFLSETAREFGSVFLPVASSFEKDGTFMNSERRIQPVRRVIEPIGRSMPDWEIICILARAMGKGDYFNFHSPEDVWDEVRRVWKAGSGITYDRLEKGGIQWPCLSEEDPGTEVLHGETFPIGRRASLSCIDYSPTEETTTDEFPFLLITGRTLTQFNAGTMTMRTRNTVFRPTDMLDISQEDAKRLSLRDGETVRIRSRYGEAVLKVKISPVLKPGERFSPVRVNSSVKTGEMFATFTDTKVFINHVTSPRRDGYVQTPEYKVTAVRIERIKT